MRSCSKMAKKNIESQEKIKILTIPHALNWFAAVCNLFGTTCKSNTVLYAGYHFTIYLHFAM